MAIEHDPTLKDRLARIATLAEDLRRAQDASEEARRIAARIQREVAATRAALEMPKTR